MPGALAVSLGEDRFAFPLSAVLEIKSVPPLTRIPGGQPFVAGVCNLRGIVLAVLDLGVALGFGSGDAGRSRMVVVGDGDLVAAFLVDRVLGVVESPAEPLVEGLPEGVRASCTGMVRTPEGPAAVLDLGLVSALRGRLGGAAA